MPAVPIIAGVAGAASTAKGLIDSNKASKTAASAPAATVNIPALQSQAQNIAAENAARSAALEAQYNPGASQLRSGSLEALMASLSADNPSNAIFRSFAAQGAPAQSVLGARPAQSAMNADLLAKLAANAGNPLTQGGFDSALTRQAVEAASRDLALGGVLPQDVRNLVARGAIARSGATTGNLNLGRDLTTRDLGLTSLDLYNRRLANAASIGQQEAALEQANAAVRQANERYGRDSVLSAQQAAAQADALASQNYATDAQIAAARDALASSNYFNQANLFQSISNGDFARALQAAQLGQNIAQPVSGLDPGSVANLAIGNANATANQAQNAAAIKAQQGNQLANLGGGLIGLGASIYGNRNATPAYTPPAGAPSYYGGGAIGNFGFS